MKRIEKELIVNMGTLETWGKYHDKLVIPELDAYISLTVIKEPQTENRDGKQIGKVED